ncbi:MAG: hypothetical protein E7497_04130 [Ruminococcus sp.]|nr:hypothetical protein [Ruminococcus sp.]
MKVYRLFAAAVGAILLTGCKSSDRVHDKNYVRALALSGHEGKIAVFDFYDEESKPYASAGEDFDALREKAELELGKTLFTGHTELIVLGDCDFTASLEFLLNEWKVSPSCLVVYSDEKEWYNIEEGKTDVLADSVRNAVKQGKSPECDIVTVLSGLLSEEGFAEVPFADSDGIDGTYIIAS